ncbi:hypothetical protein OR1_03689 [Geobacter sp. OR-1]|nr:hypothetical protein OR1_03689 [Geobacter sp. OR-1]
MGIKERISRLELLAKGSEPLKPNRVITCRDAEGLRAAQIEAEGNPTHNYYLLTVKDCRRPTRAFNA